MADIPEIKPGEALKKAAIQKHNKTEKAQKQAFTGNTAKELNLDNDPAHVINRSYVKSRKLNASSFDPEQLERTAKDMQFLNKNQKLVFGSEKVFNRALKNSKDYNKALETQKGFTEEFGE